MVTDNGRFLGPFPGQQTKFFERSEREVFYGGSGGGGKSLCGMAKFGQQLAVERQRFDRGEITKSKAWGIYLRRTMPDLRQAIDRSYQFFKDIDPSADYNINDHIWTLPSCGDAHFQFGHMQSEKDKYNYKSSEFCAAGGTMVLMADGSHKDIRDIAVGEKVQTLEGPRPVVAKYETGLKPCVRATSVFRGETVGTQVHPTTHPVLLWPSDGLPLSPLPHTPRDLFRARPHGLVWQDVESLLDGRPESPVKRVSKVDGGSYFEGSDGSRREMRQLEPWSVLAALHGPSVRQALSRSSSAKEFHSDAASSRPSAESVPRFYRYELASGEGPARVQLVEQWSTPDTTLALGAGGESGERLDSETPRGSMDRCPPSLGSRGESAPHEEVVGQVDVQLQGDAEIRIPSGWPHGGLGRIQERTQTNVSFYPHFYSGESRAATEEVLRGEVRFEWAGWFQTYDLTVDGANHYITEAGIVNAQTYVFFDELTEFTETMYEYMDTRLRSSDPVLDAMVQMCSASNPDGPGLLWVRKRFIENKEPEVVYRKEIRLRDGRVRNYDTIIIPAKLRDNPVLMASGTYEASLMNKRPEVREAILEGNWWVNPGAFLGDVWDTRYHVCEDHDVPANVKVFRSCDPGLAAPSSVTWWYVDRDGGFTGIHNLHVKNHDAAMLAGRIREIEIHYGWWDEDANRSKLDGPMDEDAFNRNLAGGPSYAKVMATCGVPWRRSRKDRFNGAGEILRRLNARRKSIHPGEPDVPLLRWMKRCKAPIETIPVLQSDPNNPNDVDTHGEDHCWDDTMYACLSRQLRIRDTKDEEDDDDNVVEMSSYRRRAGAALGVPPGGW